MANQLGKPMTSDPTYVKAEIEKNPVWKIAFVLSECLNHNAPLGWGRYIWVAEAIVADSKPKKKKNK